MKKINFNSPHLKTFHNPMELQTHPHNENRSTQKDETEGAFFSQQFSK